VVKIPDAATVGVRWHLEQVALVTHCLEVANLKDEGERRIEAPRHLIQPFDEQGVVPVNIASRREVEGFH
jgi:hypothetical protein